MKINRIMRYLSLIVLTTSALFPGNLKYKRTITFKEPMEIYSIKAKNGRLYMISYGSKSVVASDLKGNVLHHIGRKGEGPGENQSLSDYTLTDSGIVNCGKRLINSYDLEGKFIKGKRTRRTIQNVFSSGEEWFYVSHVVAREGRQIKQYFVVHNSRDEVLLKIPDETMQNAWHPKKGKKLGYDWFPSPFPNKPVFLDKDKEHAAVFFTRENYFYIIENGQLHKKKIDASITPKPVTGQDREFFFKNFSPKPVKKTKESVVFPSHKEYFKTVINWNDGWALLVDDAFIILNDKGSYRETIAFPEKLAELLSDTYPENALYQKGKDLYVIKDNEDVQVFSIER